MPLEVGFESFKTWAISNLLFLFLVSVSSAQLPALGIMPALSQPLWTLSPVELKSTHFSVSCLGHGPFSQEWKRN